LIGSLIADHWVHRWPYDDAGQSIPLLAGERVKLRRRRQTSGESASLDLEVLFGVIPLLALTFTLVVVFPVTVAVANAFSAGLAAPAGARCALLGFRTIVLIFCFGHLCHPSDTVLYAAGGVRIFDHREFRRTSSARSSVG
jgi:hypothetical protein